MIVGIVGSEGAKFTLETEEKARRVIRNIIIDKQMVVSGKCHLGGIDIWAVEEARKLGIETIEFPPEKHSWEYYKKRNLQIAENSHYVVCITVARLPETYRGMRFDFCYHCGTDKHVKSGGCWTVKAAIRMGKGRSEVIVID